MQPNLRYHDCVWGPWGTEGPHRCTHRLYPPDCSKTACDCCHPSQISCGDRNIWAYGEWFSRDQWRSSEAAGRSDLRRQFFHYSSPTQTLFRHRGKIHSTLGNRWHGVCRKTRRTEWYSPRAIRIPGRGRSKWTRGSHSRHDWRC